MIPPNKGEVTQEATIFNTATHSITENPPPMTIPTPTVASTKQIRLAAAPRPGDLQAEPTKEVEQTQE